MSTMGEAVEHVLAERELAEKLAAAREEQREECARALDELAAYPVGSEVMLVEEHALRAIRAVPLTFTPLADRIKALESEVRDLTAGIDSQDKCLTMDINSARAGWRTAEAELTLVRVARDTAMRIADQLQAEVEQVRERAAEALDGFTEAYEELKTRVPTPDQVVLLKADYERLIASLPVVRSVP